MADAPTQEPELKFAIELARLADQTRCHHVVLLDVRKQSPVTKFFLIATGTSDRQRRTVGDELIAYGKQHGFPAYRNNGYETAKWILVDFIDVVAHVFDETSRNFYDLEMLWGDCPRVTWQLPQQPGESVPPPQVEPAATPPDIEDRAARKAPAASELQIPPVFTGEPEVEEFVESEMLMTEITPGSHIMEMQEIEVIAGELPKTQKPAATKKRKVAAAKSPGTRRSKTRQAAARKTKSTAKPAATAGRTKRGIAKVKPQKAAKTLSVRPAKKSAAGKKSPARAPMGKKAIAKTSPGKSRGVLKARKKPTNKAKKG